MLKKAGYISFLLLFIVSTMGVTITKHYCGTHLINQTIYTTPYSCCKEHCNNCRNESKQIKVTDNFESTDAKFNFENSILKIFDHTKYAMTLLFGTIQDSYTTNLFYKVKACANSPSIVENYTAILQVFRL
jgi:hypothetical protein